MLQAAFSHVTGWVFDLDNTLYPPSARLFDLIEVRMTSYVMDALGVSRSEADRLRSHYWATHGTTLAGLMREHLSGEASLKMDRGRRIVYTNGCAPYAERVLDARGLSGLFDAVYGVEHADYMPKPDHAAFTKVFERDGLAPAKAAMFEDDERNLKVPHLMGMRTIHVADERGDGDHIHFHTDDLSGFLAQLF